jgi:hypothetical protein
LPKRIHQRQGCCDCEHQHNSIQQERERERERARAWALTIIGGNYVASSEGTICLGDGEVYVDGRTLDPHRLRASLL